MYSASNETHHRHGVAIIVSKKVAERAELNVVNFTDRIIMVEFKCHKGKLNVTQMDASTADKSDDGIDKFRRTQNYQTIRNHDNPGQL